MTKEYKCTCSKQQKQYFLLTREKKINNNEKALENFIIRK